ncbi:hypothetical protein VKS41_004840 [Umbelopsis sp. WA50703]
MSFADRVSDYSEKLTHFVSRNQDTVRLTLTIVASSALTATSILGYQAVRRRKKVRSIKAEVAAAPVHSTQLTSFGTLQPSDTEKPSFASKEFEESLIHEQLSRNIAFLGKDNVEKIRKSFVIVVGAGGVGSWAALMLLRSGVERIRIIDFDQVTLSSLNRHAVATQADVGTPKVKAIQKHFKQIMPQANVDARIELFSMANADELLSGNPDFVIDAIDNIETKVDLMQYCYNKKLPVIASMGAGAKADPTRIQIADVSNTFEDPLARAVRKKLKKRGIVSGVPVVYSTEKPHHVKLLPLEQEKVDNADDYAALPDFRSRILPVLGTIPSMFGMAIATHIILVLGNWPNFEPLAVKNRESTYQKIHKELLVREATVYNQKTIPFDARDVGYIFEEMWLGKSILSGPADKPALVRWDRTKPLSYSNVVCLTREEANRHDKLPSDVDLKSLYGEDVVKLVEKRFKQEKIVQELWE